MKTLSVEEGNVDTETGNKLIAKFMGAKIYKGDTDRTKEIVYAKYPEEFEQFSGATYAIKILKYHSDWNWLMPVVKKANLLLEELPHSGERELLFVKLNFAIIDVEIEKAFAALVELIQWYNENKSKN